MGPQTKQTISCSGWKFHVPKRAAPGGPEAVGFSESGVATLMESDGEVLRREGVGGTGVGYRRRGSGGIQGRIY